MKKRYARAIASDAVFVAVGIPDRFPMRLAAVALCTPGPFSVGGWEPYRVLGRVQHNQSPSLRDMRDLTETEMNRPSFPIPQPPCNGFLSAQSIFVYIFLQSVCHFQFKKMGTIN